MPAGLAGAGGTAASFSLAEGGGSVAWSASIIAPLQLCIKSKHLMPELFISVSLIYLLKHVSLPPSSKKNV